MSIPYEPLNCSINCTEMLNCIQDNSQKIICEIRCGKCGMANRFRIENYFVSMLKQYGESQCQMGRKVYRTKDETCDACKAGGELIIPATIVEEAKIIRAEKAGTPEEELKKALDPEGAALINSKFVDAIIQGTSMGCSISPEKMGQPWPNTDTNSKNA